MTDSQLNMSWTVAAANALRNSLRSPIWVNETMVLVTDVPILAPITIGMATRTVRTIKRKKKDEIIDEQSIALISSESSEDLQLAETMLTIIEEDVEELCTKTVVNMPIITPTTGFCSRSLC